MLSENVFIFIANVYCDKNRQKIKNNKTEKDQNIVGNFEKNLVNRTIIVFDQ